MFYPNAKNMWEDLCELFSLKKDFVAYYNIQSKIFNTKQGALSILEYHGILNGLWIKLDQYQSSKTCKVDATTKVKVIEMSYILPCSLFWLGLIKAKFRALTYGICEGLWMKIIFYELRIQIELPMKLLCDNKLTINIVHNSVQHDKTKHIKIDRHFIKEKLDSGFIVIAHVPIRLQVADVFTKGLPTSRFQELICKLGMIDIYLST
uniref:Copia protein n=1 Tax=Cajanus cajan TaxID=3821 RepID=A0A151RH50_CAJCA|nr:Copia protein [Cajanus cajan]